MNTQAKIAEVRTITRDDVDLDTMLEEAALAVQRVSAQGKDTKALTQEERMATLAGLSRALGLNPLTNSVRFLPMQGGEVLYVTRQATDQIAARLRLRRETLVGPEVRDIGGQKMVFCQVRVTAPDGRSEVATATLPLRDPANDLMKCETKAKRRATLSLAGLGLLTEEETETIPGVLREPPAAPPPAAPSFADELAACSSCVDLRALWTVHRPAMTDDAGARARVRDWCAERGIHLTSEGVTALLSTLPTDALRCLDASCAGDAASQDDACAALVDAARTCRAAGWDEHSTRIVWATLARGYARLTGAKSVAVAAEALRAACEEPEPPPTGTDGPARSDEGEGADAEGFAAHQHRSSEGARASLRVVREWSEEDLVTSARAWADHIGAATNPFEVRASFRKRASAFTREGVHAIREAATLERLAELAIDAPRAFLHAPPTARKRQGDKAA